MPAYLRHRPSVGGNRGIRYPAHDTTRDLYQIIKSVRLSITLFAHPPGVICCLQIFVLSMAYHCLIFSTMNGGKAHHRSKDHRGM